MKTSKREHTELFTGLVGAWLVYGVCQRDLVLPMIAFVILFISYGELLFSSKKPHFSIQLSWRLTVGIALIIGGTWRSVFEPPEYAHSFIPVLLPALQAASIVAGLLVWFRFSFQWRSNALKFLAWMTVATSINVPFDGSAHVIFWGFCLMTILFLMMNIFFPTYKEGQEPRSFKQQGPIVYLYASLLFLITGTLLFFLVRGVKMGDDVFTSLIHNYMGGRKFSFFESSLRIGGGAGRSGLDVKPICEIDSSDQPMIYLAGQVFEHYANGLWLSPNTIKTDPVKQISSKNSQSQRLVMFEFLQDIIPTPRGILSMSSKKGIFEIDNYSIVTNKEKTIPVIHFSLTSNRLTATLPDLQEGHWLQVSPEMKVMIQQRMKKIFKKQPSALMMTEAIETYFQQEYQYSLHTSFMADDGGILYLLDKKPAAYCSYFASTMVLMLRSVGIKARLVTGFLASEYSGSQKETFMVRGRDAHAWVEALLPIEESLDSSALKNPRNWAWVRFDPTPPDSRRELLEKNSRLNRWSDLIWCSQKRMKAALLEMETKTLVKVIFLMVLIIAAEEVLKKMIQRWKQKGAVETEPFHATSTFKDYPNADLYKKYRKLLRQHVNQEPDAHETEEEFIQRLHNHSEIKKDMLAELSIFIQHYQEDRFSDRISPKVNESLKKLEKKMSRL